MTPEIIGLLLIIGFIILLFLRMPIAFAMFITGFIGVSVFTSPSVAFDMIAINTFEQFSIYTYIVIPMYIWMGYLAYESGLGSKLFNMAHKWVGHLPGGLAVAAQIASAIFGAICGSVLAAVGTMGALALPEMKKYKYDMKLATGSIAAGGILGELIPPSVILMIYGIATQQSIVKLFKASIIPGIILLILYIIVVLILVKHNPALAPRAEKSTWKERGESFKGGLWEVILVFGISLGGMFAGWFTPSEAGAVAACGVLVITLVEGSLKLEGIIKSLQTTARTVAMILMLIAGATIFGRFLALSNLASNLAAAAGSLPFPPIVVMLIILFCYLVAGCFIDIPALILCTIPITFPIVVNILGYDPIWFGVIMVLIQGMGVITPPVGMSVYIIRDVAKDVPLGQIFRGIWPFLIAIFICAAILVIFPQIVTFAIK